MEKGRGAMHPVMAIPGVAGISGRPDGSYRVYLKEDSDEVRAEVRKMLGEKVEFIVSGEFRPQ